MNSSDYLIFLKTTNKMKQINKNEEEKIVRNNVQAMFDPKKFEGKCKGKKI